MYTKTVPGFVLGGNNVLLYLVTWMSQKYLLGIVGCRRKVFNAQEGHFSRCFKNIFGLLGIGPIRMKQLRLADADGLSTGLLL